MSEPKSFFQELRERRVVRVAVTYAVVAWAVFEGSASLTQAFDLPDVTPRLVFSLLVLGFPLAVVLAWAFQVTPEGVKRATPFEAGNSRGRLPFFGGLAVGVLAVSGLAFVFSRQSADPALDELDPDAVVVMPLRVSAPPELAYLGGGVMDLLASRLDGTVGPRSVDAGAVSAAAAVEGTDAATIARRFGAGRFITGSIVGNSERVVVTAELASMADRSETVTASAEGTPIEVARLVDELVAELLSLDAGEYPESVAQLTSTSPGALAAYLLGRQAWREGRYFDAVDGFERALSIDSTFALAAIARADGGNMATGRGDGGGLEIAWRHRDRLGVRDALYLEARRPTRPRTHAETLEAYERLTREQPDRLEAWYWLGETRIHRRDESSNWSRAARVPFQRVLELDPSYFPALQHLLFLDVYDGEPDVLRATAARFHELAPHFHVFRGLDSPELRLTMDTVALAELDNPEEIVVAPVLPVWLLIDFAPADFAPYVEAAIRKFHRSVGSDPVLSLPSALTVEYRARAGLGQRQTADSVYRELMRVTRAPVDRRSVLFEATWEGVLSELAPRTAEAIEGRLAGVPNDALSGGGALDLVAVEVWRFATDSTYRGGNAPARLLGAAAAADHPDDLTLEGFGRMLEAWALAREGDDVGARAALDRHDELVRIGPPGLARRELLLAAATVFEEIGEPGRAVDFLDRRSFASSDWAPYESEFIRRTGHAAAADGDTARALKELERYLKIKYRADASVQPEIDAARATLETLGRP